MTCGAKSVLMNFVEARDIPDPLPKFHGHVFKFADASAPPLSASCACGHRIVVSDQAPLGGATHADGVTYLCPSVIDDLDRLPPAYRAEFPSCSNS